MLDAIRMCGRWISSALLQRITARTLEPNPPSRQELLREFCQRTGWRNHKGQICLSSANVCVQRLEQRGLVRLPPPAPRAPRRAGRKLFDDGLPLPPLPKLPASVEQIPDLHWSLLAGAQDPQHLVWNRLIRRLHPLQGAPLVGSQLRYLLLAGSGVVGAIGFGPPSFYLSCRDCWIGWDAQAREQNRPRVIGLARFLLRPELRCANLASRAYRLVLQRVRADWQERYGVEPLLVETYVDRSTHIGKSLAAANWLRLGQSLGRGRTSPSRYARSKSVKDVWVWQWDPQARARLQERTWPAVAPRSLFRHSQEHWVGEELDGLDLRHAKLHRRFATMLQDRFAHPERSFYTSFGGAAGGKAAYAFIENPRADLQFQNLLAPHQANTRRRMAAEAAVLLAQDTTTLGYNNLLQTQGLGPVGEERHPGRGLLLHTLQAFRLDGIPLGCAWADLRARDPLFSDTARRNQQSIDQKESVRWVNAFQSAAGIAAQMPQTALVVCGDRESDMMDLYDRRGVAPSNVHFLVRGQHDRVLESGEKLWDCLSGQPLGGTMTVQIPRHKNRPARTATLELRWAKIRLPRQGLGCRKSRDCLELWALLAQEINPPGPAEAIQWVLLTDWKIDSLKTARRLIRWYGLRWGIECWHQVLKDVCRVESRQMKSAQALSRSLVLDMIVAWRVLLLCRLGKAHPHLPACLLYSPEELAVLEVLKKNALP
jgi:Domain of unknown function (DUF4338)/Transposase DNA-binding